MAATADIPEAEVVEEPGTDLAVQPPPAALFKTDEPADVLARATEVADALKGVLSRQGLTSTISGRSFVKVEGWTTLAAMMGVSAVCTDTEKLPEGGYKAMVEARMPDGRVVGSAVAVCSREENTWKKRDDYALLSMAQTRATSKALRIPLGFVVTLAGYESTPADEMPADTEPAGPPFGEAADAVLEDKAIRALSYMLDVEPDSDELNGLCLKLKADAGGYYPRIVLRALGIVAAEHRVLRAEKLAGGETSE